MSSQKGIKTLGIKSSKVRPSDQESLGTTPEPTESNKDKISTIKQTPSKVPPPPAEQGASQAPPLAEIKRRKRSEKFLDRLYDAVYLLCPDCSAVQCCTILAGLVATVILTLLFLWAGGYWSETQEEFHLLAGQIMQTLETPRNGSQLEHSQLVPEGRDKLQNITF